MPTPPTTALSKTHPLLLDRSVSELPEGSILFLWAFRCCALGRPRAACLSAAFDHHFGASGPDMLRHILVMAQILGHQGQRKIHLNLPRSDRFSRDEASLLQALGSAQQSREAGLTAQLHWLTAGAPIRALASAACIIAGGFSSVGLRLSTNPA